MPPEVTQQGTAGETTPVQEAQTAEPSAPWWASVNELKDQVRLGQDGKPRLVISEKENFDASDPLGLLVKLAVGKANASKHIDEIHGENGGLRQQVAELKGQVSAFAQMNAQGQNQSQTTQQASTQPAEPNWSLREKEIAHNFEQFGYEPQEASQRAAGAVELEKLKYEYGQLRGTVTSLKEDMLNQVQRIVAPIAMQQVAPGYSHDNPEVQQIFREFGQMPDRVAAEIFKLRQGIGTSQSQTQTFQGAQTQTGQVPAQSDPYASLYGAIENYIRAKNAGGVSSGGNGAAMTTQPLTAAHEWMAKKFGSDPSVYSDPRLRPTPSVTSKIGF